MSSPLNAAVPAGAFDEFVVVVVVEAAVASRAQRDWTPADGPTPSIYLSHGAPPLLDDTRWMRELFGWAQRMPKPKSVLIVSAHWERAPLSVSATSAATTLVYDFGGFARGYYELTYPTPDASDLAKLVASAMPDDEPVHEHRRRGLDHGAWVPLMVMYPLGDVPVPRLRRPLLSRASGAGDRGLRPRARGTRTRRHGHSIRRAGLGRRAEPPAE